MNARNPRLAAWFHYRVRSTITSGSGGRMKTGCESGSANLLTRTSAMVAPCIHTMINREGPVVNLKRVHRIWRGRRVAVTARVS